MFLPSSMASRCYLLGFLLGYIISPGPIPAVAQKKFVPNYDESKVPDYELPTIVEASSQNPVTAWEQQRRQETLELFLDQMYGRQPTSDWELDCQRMEEGLSFGGKAKREQFQVTLKTDAGQHSFDLLVFTPSAIDGPVPCFLGLNFFGNHTIVEDEEIRITQAWSRSSEEKGVSKNRATEKGRGTSKSRWPVEMIVEAGCAVATVYCGDIDPDFDDGFNNGVHRIFPGNKPSAEHPNRWGTISAWAWGLSRALDCLQSEVEGVDGDKVVVIGHSRLGKTSFWAAATDPRFAAAISNNSGCGGAALSRRAFGETVQRINDSFPHWFCGNFKQYNLNENELPIDQHQLIALIAPRPVYVASASGDRWADPRGEFLALKQGQQIHNAYGVEPLALDDLPVPGTASVGPLGYHLRDGGHDIKDWDWKHYLEFADLIF